MRTQTADHDVRFPIGEWTFPEVITPELRNEWIERIATFPLRLRLETDPLNDVQLDTPYRQDGWTIRQVVHHCADSHMNSLTRLKLALTEDEPVIKPYFEERWAELPDSKSLPLEPSLKMLEGIHLRWVVLLRSLSENDLARTFIHPEHGRKFRLDEQIGLYAWHCNHHLAHITHLKSRMSW